MSDYPGDQIEARTICLPGGAAARSIQVPRGVDARRVVAALELPAARAVLVLNGGADSLDPQVREPLAHLFAAVARAAVEERITMVTGATRSGIFGLFGEALAEQGGPAAPCIGVTVAGRAGPEYLEPHHSHFVLVEGDAWGDETPVMYRLVAVLAGGRPSLALFAGGGEGALEEMLHNVAQERDIILLEGSGGVADTLVEAGSGAPVADDRTRHIRDKGRLTRFPIHGAPGDLAALLRQRLLAGDPHHSQAQGGIHG
jgi:hypothetical protein